MNKSLFLDDDIVQDLQGLRRVLNRPVKHPENPILKPDEPWEWFHAPASIIWSDRVTILTSDEEDPPQNREFYDMKAGRYEDGYIFEGSIPGFSKKDCDPFSGDDCSSYGYVER